MIYDIEKIIQRWEKTGLLETTSNKLSLALCLEAQFKYNEANEDMSPSFRRMAIPLLIRMLNGSKASTRNNFINYFDENREKPKVYIFKTKLKTFEGDLQTETDTCESMAKEMATELDELFQDKKNNDIIFHGLNALPDGMILMYYS